MIAQPGLKRSNKMHCRLARRDPGQADAIDLFRLLRTHQRRHQRRRKHTPDKCDRICAGSFDAPFFIK